MAALTGNTIASTYTELLRMGNATLHATTGYYIKDVADTNSALSIAETRVGIGTATPEYELVVADDTNPTIAIKNTDTTLSDGQEVGNLLFTHSDSDADANNLAMGEIQVLAGQTVTGTDDSPSSMSLGIVKDGTDTITKVLYLYNNANVGIGIAAPTEKLHIYSSAATVSMTVEEASMSSTNTASCSVKGTGNGAARYAVLGVYYHSSQFGTVAPCAYTSFDSSDGETSYQWVADDDDWMASSNIAHIGTTSGTETNGDMTGSDERMKDIYSGDFPYGLSEINNLVPIKYKFKGKKASKGDKLGFGAQTTLPILPETVTDTGICIHGYDQIKHEDGSPESIPKGDPTETELHMQYTQIIPVLVKAIQELSAKVTALENA